MNTELREQVEKVLLKVAEAYINYEEYYEPEVSKETEELVALIERQEEDAVIAERASCTAVHEELKREAVAAEVMKVLDEIEKVGVYSGTPPPQYRYEDADSNLLEDIQTKISEIRTRYHATHPEAD